MGKGGDVISHSIILNRPAAAPPGSSLNQEPKPLNIIMKIEKATRELHVISEQMQLDGKKIMSDWIRRIITDLQQEEE